MAKSRKRERELKRLKGSANELWENQLEVLDHANKVLKQAQKNAGYYGREHLAPGVKSGIDSGITATKNVAVGARRKISNDVFPALASGIASAIAVIEVAKDAKVKDAVRQLQLAGLRAGDGLEAGGKRVQKATERASAKLRKSAGMQTKKKGPGRYIVAGAGIVALAGIGYAVWQTLRADDDLWISEESDLIAEREKAAAL